MIRRDRRHVAVEALIARRAGGPWQRGLEIDDLGAGVDLDQEVVGRDLLDDAADLPLDRLLVGRVDETAVGAVGEVDQRRARRRRQADLEADVARELAPPAQVMERVVGVDRVLGVVEAVETQLGDPGLDPEAPEVRHRRRLPVVGLARRRRRRDRVDLRMHVIGPDRQEVDPHAPVARLAVRDRRKIGAQPGSESSGTPRSGCGPGRFPPAATDCRFWTRCLLTPFAGLERGGRTAAVSRSADHRPSRTGAR